MKSTTFPLPVLALLLFAVTFPCNGSIVTWGTATTATGDSDVSTLGTLNRAFNLGAPGVSSTTVNTVLFSAFAVSTTPTTVGTTTLASSGSIGSFNSLGSASAPFSGLSVDYGPLLSTGVFGSAADTLTLTLSGLSIGQAYLFQWWVNDSRVGAGPNRQSISSTSGGPSVSLEHNFQNAEGGVGQFVTGTFTADAASQAILIVGASTGAPGASPQINAFQLRAVPEPATATLLLAAGTLASAIVRRRAHGR